MAYKNFSLEKLQDEFGIVTLRQNLTELHGVEIVEPSAWLSETLNIMRSLPNRSEKAKSESFIAPILAEIKRHNDDFLTIHSGDFLNADPEHGLNGECDFILGKETHSLTIDAPLFTVVEAKRQNFDSGIAQCAAQLLGARIFNEKKGIIFPAIYGVITSADVWKFIKLENSILYVEDEVYRIQDLSLLLGILQSIVNFYKRILV